MGTPRGVAWGNLRIEYVKSRRLLRFSAWGGDETLELTPDALCRELSIDADELVSTRTYLLFGGRSVQPRGGARDLLGTYAVEDMARLAFARARRDPGCNWAELVSLHPSGTTVALCWFGLAPAGRPEPYAVLPSGRTKLRRLVDGAQRRAPFGRPRRTGPDEAAGDPAAGVRHTGTAG